ncbi:hypothetical protein AOQ84DRAFT_386208 [Glonium stellatum]|uniref:Uncharacterized protein n=1 Tax=Glonium stellatum TaxID=574774 RepID=A0A8E2F931_9PEZI|nr:hypothetical protein AOQ84DRAFT_386208 [Glonium stellatum]
MAPGGAPLKKGPKQVFKVDSPFTAATWPQITSKDHDIILDMLCNLLVLLGRHRQTHVVPSKGKKRKRAPSPGSSVPLPPVPTLSTHITIGLNSTTRHLESLAALSTPHSIQPDHDAPKPRPPIDAAATAAPTPAHISLLILPHPSPPSSLPHAHFPLLTHLASLAHPSLPATRVVLLSSAAETRLASSLHLPRVGALGIMEGAPGANMLVQYVRDQLGVVEVPWLREGMLNDGVGSGWLGTRILTEGGGDWKRDEVDSNEGKGKRKKKG